MQGLVERARQALGAGPDAFLPCTLEAQEQTLRELDVSAPNLQDMLKAAQGFAGDTKSFLEASAKHITEAPLPQLWMQGSPTEPAEPAQIPVPTEHAAWFDAGVAEREAGIVPASVSYALQQQVVAPIEQWLWAYQVAQGYMSELQSKCLPYDEERRKLVGRATAATTPSAGHHAAGSGIALDPELAQLTEEAAAINATMSEFESDAEALEDLLHWLVEGAVRLKALLADTAGGVGVAAYSWAVPAGIMPPLPEKSSFGQDLEVTVTLSDALLGDKSQNVVASATSTSQAGGVTTLTSFHPHTKSHAGAAGTTGGGGGHGSSSSSGGDSAPPDLSAILNSDDSKVLGGGVAPSSRGGAQPSGGGVGQLLRESLLPPSGVGSGSGSGAGQEPASGTAVREGIIPHLSDVLPTDDAVSCAGGVAPLPEPGHASPPGGGVGQLLQDTIVPPTDNPTTKSSDLPAAPEVAPRSAHSYSGEGTGRLEESKPDAAATGLRAGQRQLGRAQSAGSPASPAAAGGDSLGDEVSAEGKELVVTAPQAASDAASTTTTTTATSGSSDSSSTADTSAGGIWGRPQHTAAAAAAAAAGAAKQVASAVVNTGPGLGVGGGSDESADRDAAPADAAGQEQGEAGQQKQEQEAAGVGGGDEAAGEGVAEQFFDAAEGAAAEQAAGAYASRDMPAASALAPDDAGSTPPVGLTEPATADPAPDQPSMPRAMPSAAFPPMAGSAPTAENIREAARRVRGSLSRYSEATGGSAEHGAEAPPHTGPVALPESVVGNPPGEEGAAAYERGQMHIGPEQPDTVWIKGATPPGGAAAGGVVSREAEPVSQGQMHIGPEQPAGGPSAPAPGSPVWIKGATPPGGAAAAVAVAAAPAGSDDDARPEQDINKGNTTGAGPDLSKILPNYEHGIAEPSASPEGGSVCAFIRDTLLGPPAQQQR